MGEQKRRCDFCGESVALLYCRADAAKLCLSCDRKVHSTNQLFTKHTRSLLCDACDSSSASIYCSTESFVHCQNCDWERHKLSVQPAVHDRRPLEGFTGCPSVAELLAFVGFEDVDKKGVFGGGGGGDEGLLGSGDYGFSDLLVWDTPSFVSLDDLIAPTHSADNLQVMVVPPLPKNRNAACGKYKDEILRQLQEMARSEPNFDSVEEGIEALIGYECLAAERNLHPRDACSDIQQVTEPTSLGSYEVNTFQLCCDSGEVGDQMFSPTIKGFEANSPVPDRDSDIGDNSGHANVDHGGESRNAVNAEFLKRVPKVLPRELTSQERDSALSRYKEKRKNRRYEKHIRYESRKVRAESRIRIKGRFAKMDQKKANLC